MCKWWRTSGSYTKGLSVNPLIDILIDTQSTLSGQLSLQSVHSLVIFTESPLSVDRYIWVGQCAANCWLPVHLAVNWVLIRMFINCQSSVDRVLTGSQLLEEYNKFGAKCWQWGRICFVPHCWLFMPNLLGSSYSQQSVSRLGYQSTLVCRCL